MEETPAWDGRDIWPQLTGRSVDPEPRTLYWKTPSASAIRRGKDKLIVHKKRDRAELFDLDADPYEKQDLAPKHADRVAEMRALLDHQAKLDR